MGLTACPPTSRSMLIRYWMAQASISLSQLERFPFHKLARGESGLDGGSGLRGSIARPLTRDEDHSDSARVHLGVGSTEYAFAVDVISVRGVCASRSP